ncbi:MULTISPECIES: hypothetical protein [unclassified Nostoc]|uniref:hypothetical protein n=1 Tax=unclassified Nostoc TaxID=2593658 RepID=UPI00117D3F47|nr:hypothetical protein [Nostoc sp. 'Peltigera membranacea cyanobiont' 232]
MTIPLFSKDARRSLFIRSRSVPQGRGEEGRREQMSRGFDPYSFEATVALAFRRVRELSGCLKPLLLLPRGFIDQINNSVSLNAVNLQPTAYEVFYARS